MRELTACGSCELVWLDSLDSFMVAALGPAKDTGRDTGRARGRGRGSDSDSGTGTGAAAAHVCPKYRNAILPTPFVVRGPWSLFGRFHCVCCGLDDDGAFVNVDGLLHLQPDCFPTAADFSTFLTNPNL